MTTMVSPGGVITLPSAVMSALGLTAGSGVRFVVDGKSVRLVPMTIRKSVKLEEIQAILTYAGPTVPIEDMRV